MLPKHNFSNQRKSQFAQSSEDNDKENELFIDFLLFITAYLPIDCKYL